MTQQDISQPKVFLGAYVQRLSASFGLNSQPTTVEVDLIEGNPSNAFDVGFKATGFQKASAEPGTVTGIMLGAFRFGGVVQSWTYNESQQGKTYSVRLVDPRILFQNIPLVLDGLGLPGSTGLTDYYNVFKYYGTPALADSTENGMTWKKIREFLQDETTIFNCYRFLFSLNFSSGFQDSSGAINVSGVPYWYRINTNQSSLDQCLNQVSSDLGMDYYVYAEPSGMTQPSADPGTWPLQIKHIHRSNEAVSSDITNFINNARSSGILIGHSYGKELRSEPTTVLYQGPQLAYWECPNAAELKNVWGRTDDGSLVTTEYGDDAGIILLDHITGSGSERIRNTVTYQRIDVQKTAAPSIYPPTVLRTIYQDSTTGYLATSNIMRASLFSQEAWEAMLYREASGFANQLGITVQRFRDQNNLINQPSEIRRALSLAIVGSGITNRDDITENLIKAVYEATRSTVEENFGKCWLVRINTSTWLASGTYPGAELLPRIEFEPAPAAWSQAISAPSGATLNHPNLQLSTNPVFKDHVGRLKSFVSIINYGTRVSNDFPYPIDTSRFGRDSYFVETQGNKLVIPIEVEAYDKSPENFIITANTPIEGLTGGQQYYDQKPFYDFLIAMGFSDANIRKYRLMDNADENKQFGLSPPRPFTLPTSPNVYGFFIACQRNDKTYGNFVASGFKIGGVKIITDSSLAPWTYGNYANFNTAGQQLSNRALAPAVSIDVAEVSLAGLPLYNIGDPIGQTANISAMTIQYGVNGFSTNYSLRTFAIPPTKLSKLLVDKISNAYNRINYQKREIVDLNKQLVRIIKPVEKPSQIEDALKTSLSRTDDFGQIIGTLDISFDGLLQ